MNKKGGDNSTRTSCVQNPSIGDLTTYYAVTALRGKLCDVKAERIKLQNLIEAAKNQKRYNDATELFKMLAPVSTKELELEQQLHDAITPVQNIN